MRERSSDRAHVAHDVQLPHRIPVLVGDLLEARLNRVADVVDEDVKAPELAHRGLDQPCRRVGLGQVRPHVQRLADRGRLAPAAGDDPRAFRDEQLCRLEADPARRAGDDARLPVQSEVHRRLA